MGEEEGSGGEKVGSKVKGGKKTVVGKGEVGK